MDDGSEPVRDPGDDRGDADDRGGADVDPVVLERLHDDLAALREDFRSAPEVPAEVTDRVVAALRAAPGHAARPAVPVRIRRAGLIVGIGATAVAAVLGAVMLARAPQPTAPPSGLAYGPTANEMTVADRPVPVPLPEPEIVALLTRAPQLGPLTDPQRLTSCLSGLGYPPGTEVLGARELEFDGQPAVLLLLPGDSADTLAAKVVAPECNAAHTGLSADSVLARP